MNNFNYLKLLIRSIEQNSDLPHNIVVHVNESTNEIIDWLKNKNITHTHSLENIGLCKGTNLAVTKTSKDWLCFFDDDMYALPGWDSGLINYFKNNNLGYSNFKIFNDRLTFNLTLNDIEKFDLFFYHTLINRVLYI